MNKNFHRPIHVYLPEQNYFITISTYKKKNILNSVEKLNIIKESLNLAIQKYKMDLYAWVILMNHLHLLLKIREDKDLPNFIRYINSRNSVLLNKLNQTNNKNFYQYWDTCIKDENDFYTKINYIHYNPVHHKLSNKPENYIFSSYNDYLNKYGKEWLSQCLEYHPINEERYKDDSF